MTLGANPADDPDWASQGDLQHPSVDLAGDVMGFVAGLSESAISGDEPVADDSVFPPSSSRSASSVS